ncbi:MAG: hypothetical protein ACR2H3_11160 [Acidimicrobiales bacterium]
MTRQRVFRTAAALMIVASMAVGAGLPAVGQTSGDEPEAFLLQYGWWNKAQQVPGTSPVPKPPNAPEDGLYIQYESTTSNAPTAVTGPVGGGLPTVPGAPPTPTVPTGEVPPVQQQALYPSAYAAVRYEAPEGAEGRLTLTLENRSSTTPYNVDPLVGAVLACLATSPWDSVQNGRFDTAPTYDCAAASSVTIAGDQLVFELPRNLQMGRTFDLVLVPVGEQPFAMSITRPNDDSFVITNPDELRGPVEEPVYEDLGPPLTETGETFFIPPETFTVDTTPLPTPSTTIAPAPRPRPTQAAPVLNPFRKDASRGERIAAVSLLLLIAAALWWFGGQPVRAPRLLGSLGAKQLALVPVGAAPRNAPVGGIGRFARPRLGPAPKL